MVSGGIVQAKVAVNIIYAGVLLTALKLNLNRLLSPNLVLQARISRVVLIKLNNRSRSAGAINVQDGV
jgi:hypothetical protein